MASTTKTLLNLTEAAAKLGISRQQVRKYVDSGRIPLAIEKPPLIEERHCRKPAPRKPGPKTKE